MVSISCFGEYPGSLEVYVFSILNRSLAIIFLSILFTLPLHAQETWMRVYGGDLDDFGNDIICTNDGNYVIVGSSESFGPGDSDIYLIKINSAGERIWSKTIGGAGDDEGNKIIEDSEGNLLIVGNTHSFNGDDSDIYLVKTDDSGNLLWERSYGSSDDEYAVSFLLTPENEIVIAGNSGYWDNDIILLKVNDNGDSLWSKQFLHSNFNAESLFCNSIALSEDGNLLIAGSVEEIQIFDIDFGPEYHPLMIKTNSSGDTLWTKHFDSSDLIGKDVLQLNTGEIIYCASYSSDRFFMTWRHFLLIKLSNSGNVIWKRYFAISYNEDISAIKRLADGGFILIGSAMYVWNPLVTQAVLIKTNPHCDIVWTQRYGAGRDERFNSVVQKENGGFIAVGSSVSTYYKILAVSTNVLGSATGIEGEEGQIPREYVLHQNYPNPFNPETTISYSLPKAGSVTLKVYDILGRLVRTLTSGEQPAGNHEAVWNGRNISGIPVAGGIYICRLSAGDFTQTIKMLLLK